MAALDARLRALEQRQGPPTATGPYLNKERPSPEWYAAFHEVFMELWTATDYTRYAHGGTEPPELKGDDDG